MTRRLSVFSLGLVLAIFLVVLYLRSSGGTNNPCASVAANLIET